MKISTPAIVAVTFLAGLSIGALGFAAGGGWTLDGALMATRLTARFSFPIFLLAWTASAWASLFPGGWRTALLRRRRAVGLSFAAAHGVHLGFIVIALNVFGHPAPMVSLYGGGFVYLLIAAMALTSNDAAVRWLGPDRWKALHTFGGVAILAVFIKSYGGRLMTQPVLAIPALALIVLAIGLKLSAWRRRRTRAARVA